MRDGGSKRGEFAEFESEMDVPSLFLSFSQQCLIYFEIRPFSSKIPEMWTIEQNNIQIDRIREQQEKNREKDSQRGYKKKGK